MTSPQTQCAFFIFTERQVLQMTARQQRFADEYLIDMNAEQAAIRAGYSEKYARGNAHKLVANSFIQEYIQKRMAEKDSELIASQDEVLQTLTAIMRREKKEVIVASHKVRKSYFDEEGRKCVNEEEVPVMVEIDTKISDVNKAAELLGKRYGLFSDKVNVESTQKVVIVDDLDE